MLALVSPDLLCLLGANLFEKPHPTRYPEMIFSQKPGHGDPVNSTKVASSVGIRESNRTVLYWKRPGLL